MTKLVHTLESCWYLSPPWGKEIPPLVINLLEIAYISTTKSFGYCCGVEWSDNGWNYAVACDRKIVSVLGHEIIGTGRLQAFPAESPVFMVGELVRFRFADDRLKIRTVLGLQLIDSQWVYIVELASPTLSESSCEIFTSGERKAWVSDYDLIGV
ncbi:MAG: DUF1392 family protein [Nostoc sp.]|uniref:DUF1392 family protein n=1 Tax=Nostoc sp. TaxID=1180 RepID=UPI002FF83E77